MNKVKEFIKEKKLIQNGDHIIIGVSGGADSVYLLLILNELRESMNLTITAVHINHMIRREAVDDQKFVQDLCGQLSIPCKIFEIDVKQIAKREKMSLEEAGRKARYDAFAKTMKKYNADKIAIAHHQNDQAETFLYRVVRGTGIYGCHERKRWKSDPSAFMCKKRRNSKIFKRGWAGLGRRCKQSGRRICKKSDPKSGNSKA